MVSLTAPTLWLPGFNPEPMAFTESPTDIVATDASQSEPGAQSGTPDASVDATPQRRNWRVITPSPEEAPRTLWPALERAQLRDTSGSVTKFYANLRAITLLRQLEAEHRDPAPEERSTLLRYTGWGGLPASFNLDAKDPAWAERAQQLASLLTAEEYESARASVNNSHYTEVHVIEAIWQAVQRFGFQNGRILEPAAGIGHFIGAMPRAIAERSDVTAIEIDDLSGRLMKALYQPGGVDVRINPFEKTSLPDNWFDLVIGNVPFGKYPAFDASTRPYARFSIHNYFFGRALDLVRPGGLVCLITTSFTLDALDSSVRHYLGTQAQFLGAIRLPKGAFAGIASTDVQTDVVFLRRRQRTEAVDETWLNLRLVPDSLRHPQCHTRYLQVNAWYAEHPEFCIGQIRQESNGYEEVPIAVFDGDLEAELPKRIALLPENVYQALDRTPPPVRVVIPAEPGARPGSYRLHQGRVHRVERTEMIDVHDRLNATQRSRIVGLCAVRDYARNLLDAQLNSSSDERLGHLRALLNGTYDRYVAKYGCLSTRANAMAFRRDPDYPLLLSLEHYDEESDTAKKAALFTRRTLTRVSEPRSVGEPAEALAASIQWRGRVHPGYMASLLNAPERDVLQALVDAGQIYLDPADFAWKTADDYLSGNVKAKLQQATMSGSEFRRNVVALEQVQPEDLLPDSIEPRLGAVWIPAADIEDFVLEVLELKDCEVSYSPEAGAWSVDYREWNAKQSLKVTQEYRMHTRFARFINVPELMAVFGEVADIRTAEMLNLPVPKLRGEKPRIVACPASKSLKAFVKTLVQRAEAIRNGKVAPQDDNMLAITTDGRKAALDFRLVAPMAAFDAKGKVAACVREVMDIWQRTHAFRGTQLVFCDLSSPKGDKAFSVYDDLRKRLIEAGMPAQEIAFVHDAESDVQKATLFKAVREGRIRVLLGSTAKMGVGTNVQTRLCALHHLDAPWRPCDVEQREGRILRQGNECEEVEIFRYVTEQSFDAYLWQTLETKARFIAQVMKGDKGIRSLEDVELATLSYAEVKALASGNPLVIEKAGVDAEVAKLSTLFSVWRNQRYANESEVGRLPTMVEAMEKKVALMAQDLERVVPQTMAGMSLELAGNKVTGADAAGDLLRSVVKAAREEVRANHRTIEKLLGHFGGFDLGILADWGDEVPNLYLSGHCVYDAQPYQTGPALVAGLLDALSSIAKHHAEGVVQLAQRRKRLEDLRLELSRTFEHEGRLVQLLARQRELLKQLDLDKDEAGSAKVGDEDMRMVA